MSATLPAQRSQTERAVSERGQRGQESDGGDQW